MLFFALSTHGACMNGLDSHDDSATGMEMSGLFQALFHGAPDSSFILGEHGRILDCTYAACELFGYSHDEMTVLDPLKLLSRDALGMLPEYLKEENITGSFSGRQEFVRHDGSPLTADIVSNSMVFAGKRFRWLTVRETEQDDPAQTLAPEFTELSGRLPEYINEPAITAETDYSGLILSANDMGMKKTGYTNNDIRLGLSLLDLIPEDDHPRLLSDMQHIAGGGSIERVEYTLLTHDGGVLPVIASANRIVRDDGKPGVQIIALDISEHKNAEHELLVLEKLRHMGELASGVAHDFNNTLGVILGYSQIHKEKCGSERCAETLDNIIRAAEDGVSLVRRIQTYTQSSTPQPPEPVNLNVIASEAVDFLEPKWRHEALKHGKHIAIEKRFTDIPSVMGNAAELREVVCNFILNSLDAIVTEGVITIISSHGGDYVSLDIADNGCGMSDTVRSRVFDPFFTTKKGRGTGLGMCVSHSIVASLGGDVAIESEEGQGTTVSILLPVPYDAGGEAPDTSIAVEPDTDSGNSARPFTEASVSPDSVHAGGRADILVIDDEANICEILKEFLENKGYSVTTAPEAETGLSLFREHLFPVVITDLNMPGLSGWDLAESVKNEAPGTFIIMLSGWNSDIDKRANGKHAIDSFMQKPIDFRELLNIIASSGH